MTKIDDWMIQKLQAAYDYLWDRWGIYVGQCGQFFIVADFGITVFFEKATPTSTIFAVIVLALLELRNWMQRKGDYVEFNIGAMQARGMWLFRWIITIFLLPLNIASMSLLGILASVFFLGFMLSYCLMVRDRDESRFKEHKLAYQEHGNG